jgi:hypothetical protein
MRRLAILLIAGAAGANVAFLGLGAMFNYPDVLREPAAEVLANFQQRRYAVSALFLLLAASAAVLAPIGIQIARVTGHRSVAALGIAAAAVQVVGLLRWPLGVPFLGDRPHAFETLNLVLGTIVGETLGYLLTAAWTWAVVHSGLSSSRALAAAGLVAAALIASGVLVPLGVPGADLANFAGYVLWSLWLVATAINLLLGARQRPGGTGCRPAQAR